MEPARLGRRDRAAVGGLLAVVLFVFSDALRPGWTFWYRDIYGYWSAQVASFVRVVSAGAMPLWNPYASFGLPMLADPSYQVVYPPSWANFFLGPVAYYKVYVVAHAFAGGLGLFVLLKRLGLGRHAAFTGAVAWIASGPFLVVVSHTHHFAGTAWIPWVLLALDATLERGTTSQGVTLGVVGAAQVLAGSGDLCLMTAFLGALWIGARAVNLQIQARPPWSLVWRALGVAVSVAAGLSAIQWLPTLAILRGGLRLELHDVGRLYWSLHPASLADFLVPRLVADLPLEAATRAALFESREPLFADHYVGAGAFVLAALGLLACRGPLRNYAAVGLAATLLLSFGDHTPVYPALMRVTPLGLLRFPSKYVIAVGFFWALLVALGTNALFSSAARRRPTRTAAVGAWILALLAVSTAGWVAGQPEGLLRILAPVPRGEVIGRATAQLAAASGLLALGGLLAWIGVGSWRGAGAARGALVVLALGDLALAGRRVSAPAPADLLTTRPRVAELVPEGSRVYVPQSRPNEWLELSQQPLGWDRQWAFALGRLQIATPPTSARYGLRGSFDGDFTGLAPPLLSNLTLILSGAGDSALALRLLRLAGVDYVVAPDARPWTLLQPVTQIPSVLRGPVRLFRVPGSFPEAYLVGRVRWAGEPRSIMLIGDAAFDPEREVILSGTGSDGGEADFRGTVRELRRGADRLEFEAEASAPAHLVVLQTYDPGWRAAVDGIPTSLFRANVLFQGVPVPSGRHFVSLSYRPPAVLWGLVLSSACAIAVLGFLLAAAGKRRAG